MKLTIATTVLALTTGAAFAQEPALDMPELAKPKIEFIEAAGIAGKAAEGDLVALKLGYINGNEPVYLADLESKTGFAELMIDGNDGNILASGITTAASEEALEVFTENFSAEADLADMIELLEIQGVHLDLEDPKMLEVLPQEGE